MKDKVFIIEALSESPIIAKDYFMLSIGSDKIENVKLYNFRGYSINIKTEKLSDIIRINVENIDSGVYFAHYKADNKEYYVKVIKE